MIHLAVATYVTFLALVAAGAMTVLIVALMWAVVRAVYNGL